MAIKKMFKGYKRVTTSMLKTLEGYGLIVNGQGKHYKVYRLDTLNSEEYQDYIDANSKKKRLSGTR